MTSSNVQESNLILHARRELELLGEEQFTVDGYLKMIAVFDDMGHSGGSASVFIPTLTALLSFENLTPLTDDPKEWNKVGVDKWGDNEGPVWQSARRSEAFSHDGGKTYYLLSEGAHALNQKPIHNSWPEACRRFHRFDECKPGENHPVVNDD